MGDLGGPGGLDPAPAGRLEEEVRLRLAPLDLLRRNADRECLVKPDPPPASIPKRAVSAISTSRAPRPMCGFLQLGGELGSVLGEQQALGLEEERLAVDEDAVEVEDHRFDRISGLGHGHVPLAWFRVVPRDRSGQRGPHATAPGHPQQPQV